MGQIILEHVHNFLMKAFQHKVDALKARSDFIAASYNVVSCKSIRMALWHSGCGSEHGLSVTGHVELIPAGSMH